MNELQQAIKTLMAATADRQLLEVLRQCITEIPEPNWADAPEKTKGKIL